MKRTGKILLFILAPIITLLVLFVGITSNATSSAEDFYNIRVRSGTTFNIENGTIKGGGVYNAGTLNVLGGVFESNPDGDICNDGVLNLSGGTFSGQIINNKTLNFTKATFNDGATILLNAPMNFKAAPTAEIPITLSSGLAQIGQTIGTLDGISTLDVAWLAVSNLPDKAEIEVVGKDIKIMEKEAVYYTVTVVVDNPEFGDVRQHSLKVKEGSTWKPFTSGTAISFSYGGGNIEAYPHNSNEYTVTSVDWSPKVGTVTEDTTITVHFNVVKNVKVTIVDSPEGCGAIIPVNKLYVPLGTMWETSGNRLIFTITKGFGLLPGETREEYVFANTSSLGEFREWYPETGQVMDTGTGEIYGFVGTEVRFVAYYNLHHVSVDFISNEGGTISEERIIVPFGTTWSLRRDRLNTSLVFTYGGEEIFVVDPIADEGWVLSGWAWSGHAPTSGKLYNNSTFTATFERGCEVTFTCNPKEGGTTSERSIIVPQGTEWFTRHNIAANTTSIVFSYDGREIYSVDPLPAAGYFYKGWSYPGTSLRGEIMGNVSFEVIFQKGYEITFTSDVPEFGSISQQSIVVPEGTTWTIGEIIIEGWELYGNQETIHFSNGVDVTAIPKDNIDTIHYSFSEWRDESGSKFANTGTVVSNMTFQAHFYISLKVTYEISQGSIRSYMYLGSGSPYLGEFQSSFTTYYNFGSIIYIQNFLIGTADNSVSHISLGVEALPNIGYQLYGWQDGSTIGYISSSMKQAFIIMGSTTISALCRSTSRSAEIEYEGVAAIKMASDEPQETPFIDRKRGVYATFIRKEQVKNYNYFDICYPI